MSDLILPGKFGLILVRDEIGRCYACHQPFYSERDMRAHFQTVEHRQAMEDLLIERLEHKRRLALFHDDEQADVELEEHFKKIGKRMLAEGRMTVRKNERAAL